MHTLLFETVWLIKDTSLVRGSIDFNWPVFCAVNIVRFLNGTAIKQTQVLGVSLVSVERLTLLPESVLAKIVTKIIKAASLLTS
jgi:hypothetical protein